MTRLRLLCHGCGADGLGFVSPEHLLGFVSPKCSPVLARCRWAKLHRSGGGGARPPLGKCPQIRGVKAPTGAVRIAAPLAALRLGLSLQRKGTAGHMTRAGAPIGASPRQFP